MGNDFCGSRPMGFLREMAPDDLCSYRQKVSPLTSRVVNFTRYYASYYSSYYI